jgi:hypothetical protein
MVHWNTGISVTNGSRHRDTLEEVERWLTNLLDADRVIDPDVDVTARARPATCCLRQSHGALLHSAHPG